MKNNTAKYEQRIIVFIDILGFKEIVRQSESDPIKIELLYSVLTFLKDWETSDRWNLKFVEIEEDAQKRGVKNFEMRGKTNTTSFSDSVVVSVKVDSNINEMVSTLVANLAHIGSKLMEKGILFRGGMTIGSIVHDDFGTVFGQGLIDAYLLEERSAKYPRVILSDKLIAQLNYPLSYKRERYPYHQYIQRFEDGCVGFHQMIHYEVMQSWIKMTHAIMINNLETIRKVILKGLDDSFEDANTFEKYKWLVSQYNRLIILDHIDLQTKKKTILKRGIRNLNDQMSNRNIHFAHTDKYHIKKEQSTIQKPPDS